MFTFRSSITPISQRICIISTLVLLLLLFTNRNCTAFELYLGTGNTDTFSYFAGKSICSSIKRHDKSVTCNLVPSIKSTDTLTNLHNGSLDLALVSSKTIYDAFHNSGFFQYITIDYNNLRLLFPYYRSPISLLVRKDARISNINDLKGKRINSGPFNSLENHIFNELMRVKKWDKNSFPLIQNLSHSNSQDFLAIKSGSVQAMLHVGMHPDWKLRNFLNKKGTTLIAIDDADIQQMILGKTGFCKGKLDKNIYPAIDRELKTLGMETFLVTSADTDNNTVELILTAINESKKMLQQAHSSLIPNRIETSTLNNSYLPPHPAAMMFFQSTLY